MAESGSASSRRKAVCYIIQRYNISVRRAFKLVNLSRTAYSYQSKRAPHEALRKRIREVADTRVRYGYKRIHVMLKREGIHVNKKRAHRLYCLEGLQLGQRDQGDVSVLHTDQLRK